MTRVTIGCVALALAGCGSAGADDAVANDQASATDSVQQQIVRGTPATAYPEAALLDGHVERARDGVACSGALLAPMVVLTAGHCVLGVDEWRVTLPFAGDQTATSHASAVLDYRIRGRDDVVNARAHDIALVFLDAPLKLARASDYPEIARTALLPRQEVVCVGRARRGEPSDSALFVSASMRIRPAASLGFAFDYVSDAVIEWGDSGGPAIADGTAPHRIVAVDSGANAHQQVMARVDLVADWIDAQVAAHGGTAH